MLAYNISQSTLWIVGAFLLITLIIGLYAGRGIKDIRDYVLGKRNFSTLSITITMLATVLGGGSTFGATKAIYSHGIIATVATFGIVIHFLFLALVIPSKIIFFKKSISLGDVVGELYGKESKIISGILGTLYALCVAGGQLVAIGIILNSFLGINQFYGICIAGLILGIYSSIGGIKAVTFTDIFQFLIMITIIPLIATLVLKKIGNYKLLLNKVPNESLLILNHKQFSFYIILFILWIIPSSITDPASMQRLLMANSENQIRNSYFIRAAFIPVFRLVVMIIALSAMVLYPNIKGENAFTYIIKDLLTNSITKGLAISALLAMVMSTADSYLHIAGVSIIHDVIEPIFENDKKKINELFYVKILTFLLTIICIIIACKARSVFKLTLFAVSFISPLLTIPLLLGILGMQPYKKGFWLSMIITLFTFIIASLYLPSKFIYFASPIGTVVNGISFVCFHLIKFKGIAWIKTTENKQGEQKKEKKLWIPNPEKILDSIINSIPTPKKIYAYSRFQVMKNGSENMIFGIYCCINFTLPYFLWDHQDTEKFNLMTNLRFLGGIMAGLLIVKDQWKDFLKPYYPIYWHITLTFCLPFITTIMFLLTGGSLSWLMNVGTSIFFLIMLVAGEVFLILAPLGIGLGIIFYKYFVGPINLASLGFDINYFLFYQVFFSTVIGLLFAYRKQVSNVIKGNIGLNLGESMCHELRNTLYSLSCNQYNRMRINPIIDQGTKKIEGEESYVLPKKLLESILDETNNAIDFDNDTIKVIATFEKIFKDYKKSLTNPGVYSMKSTIEYTLNELHFLPGQKERIETNLIDDFYAKIPKELFAFVISNIIRNSFKHGGPKKVNLKLENHKLIISDDGKGIPSSDLEKVFKMHYTTGKKDSTGIGLGFSKIVVNSFQGDIWCESEEGENSYTEFHIKFPEVDPSEITTKTLKESNEEGKSEGERSQQEKFVMRMLEKGESIKKIEEYSDLIRSEIEEIKKKL